MKNEICWLIFVLCVIVYGSQFAQQEYCDRFLQCEVRMMQIHKKCTNNSRNEVAQTCDLVKDFSELSQLMHARVEEFSTCVKTESRVLQDSLDPIEIDESECQVSESSSQNTPRSCWEAVAKAKQRCQQLQKCCPSVKTCLKSGKNSPLTRALKEKHAIINGRTTECRNEMRDLLKRPHLQSDKMAAKARGFLIAQGEKVVENIIQIDQLEKFNEPAKRLETTNIRMPIEDKMHMKMQHLVKELTKIILNENSSNIHEETTTIKPDVKPIEEEEVELPTTTQSTENSTPLFAPKVLVKKPKKHHKHEKEEFVESNPIRNLSYHHPRFSFSIPSDVNLTKLNVFAARPQLLRNSTISPLNYKQIELFRTTPEPITNDPWWKESSQVEAPVIRKPLPPAEPPVFKVDSASQNVMASRVLMPPNQDLPNYNSLKEQSVDSETETEVNWHRRRNRIFAASNVANASAVQLKLINRLRHKHDQLIATTTPETITTTPEMITTQLPSTAITPKKLESYNPDDEAQLIKLLRQFKLKPDEPHVKMTIKKSRPFDTLSTDTTPKPPNEENKLQIYTNNRPVVQEKVFFVDGSTEAIDEAFVKELTNKQLETTITTTTQISQLKSPLKSGHLFKHKSAPPVDAEANKPLFGYRQKVLSVRRLEEETTSVEVLAKAKPISHILDNESQQPQAKHNNNTDENIERTTVAYAPTRIMSVNLADVLVPINWKEIRRAPAKQFSLPPPVVELSEDNSELTQVRLDLIRNLQEFLERREFDKKHQQRELVQLEEKRLALLRRSRSDYEQLGKTTGYCELYSTCTDQLKFVQNQCQQKTNQDASTFFKRKFGSCNARLFKQYQETDQLRLELLEIFENCIIDEIAVGNAKTIESCRKDWPTLPIFDDQLECTEKTRLIHDHCTNLGKCCDSLKVCKEEAGKHDLFQKLTDAKRMLNKNAQKCKLSSIITTTPFNRSETIVPHQNSRLI